MSLTLQNTSLVLRLIKDDDAEVLFEMYAETRQKELEITGWSTQQKQAFLQQQFDAQHVHYQRNYTGADFWIIQLKDQPIGRLYLHTSYGIGIRIIDITLLPGYRNKGIGSGILIDILRFAGEAGKAVSIHVESFNPAMNLYERLGFRQKSITNGVYHLMEYKSRIEEAEPV